MGGASQTCHLLIHDEITSKVLDREEASVLQCHAEEGVQKGVPNTIGSGAPARLYAGKFAHVRSEDHVSAQGQRVFKTVKLTAKLTQPWGPSRIYRRCQSLQTKKDVPEPSVHCVVCLALVKSLFWIRHYRNSEIIYTIGCLQRTSLEGIITSLYTGKKEPCAVQEMK